jgi:hypothetical protein
MMTWPPADALEKSSKGNVAHIPPSNNALRAARTTARRETYDGFSAPGQINGKTALLMPLYVRGAELFPTRVDGFVDDAARSALASLPLSASWLPQRCTTMPTDEQQFFKDLGATAEEAVEQVRGVEKNYFSLLQNAAFAAPWIVDVSKTFQSCADRNIATALDFSHRLSRATGFLDLAQI